MEKDISVILLQILEEIKLLTVKTKADSAQEFNKEYLNSDLRKQMYNAFDGERTLSEISADIGCKINTLQIFAQSLIEKDLVDFETKGNSRIINKSASKIAIYYANKKLEEAQNVN